MKRSKGKTFLITGANGFIGSHLVKRLRKDGQRVITLDYHGRGTDIKVDIVKINALKKKIRQITSPVTVIHLAACVDSRRDYLTSKRAVRGNILGTLNLLEAVRNLKIELFVNVSTEEVYGENAAPFHEQDKINPRTPYAISKSSAEYFVQMYHHIYNLPVVMLRFAAIFGPNQNPGKLIPYCIISALKGKDIVLHSSRQKRDFIYIDDAVEAIKRISFTRNVINETINFGGGKPYQIKDVAKLVLDGVKGKSRIRFRENILLSSFPRKVTSDYSKARRLLGWRPRVTMEEGMKKTVTWYRNHSGG
jgi:nucleoside-diphosphate-sugar epimerase